MSEKPVVAIVGRPNVGKSTLFNRIVGERIAIVEEIAGVTRDRLYMDAEWSNRTFTLVDTGGLDYAHQDIITSNIRKQANIAIKEADVILFVVDSRDGLTPVDQEIADILRKTDKPIILAANKVDDFQSQKDYIEFYSLGLGAPIPVSASQGLNTGDLMDAIIESLPQCQQDGDIADSVRIAFIGRPNVGKSSLVNKILGEERVIVSNIPGTTRDAIDTYIERDGNHYILVDTAGIRRKTKVDESTEKYSIIRSLRAIDRCDVVLLVIDAEDGVTEQDKKIAGYAHDQGKASVVLINKWDLVKKDNKTFDSYSKEIREELGFMKYAPLVFVSALTGQRVNNILATVERAAQNHNLRVATPGLNNLIREAVLQNPPPTYKTRRLKISYVTQNGIRPPKFTFFVNDTGLAHFSYLRYLEKQIRAAYGFEGTPIRLLLRKKDGVEE